MVLGVVVRLTVAMLGEHGPGRFTFKDSSSYLEVAGSLPRGLWSPSAAVSTTSLARTPMYPLFLRLTGGDRSVVLTIVAQCLLGGALNVWLAHRLAHRALGSRRPALVAAVVCALDPASISHSLLIATETLAATFLLAALLGAVAVRASVREGTGPWPPAAATGAAAAALALTRPNLAVFVVAVPALVAAAGPWRRTVPAAALALAVGLVPVAGWVARNHHVGGTAVLSTVAGQNLADFGLAAVAADRGELSWTDLDRSGLNRVIEREAIRTGLSPAVDGDIYGPATDRAWTSEGLAHLRAHPAGAATVSAQGLVRSGLAPAVARGPGRPLAAAWVVALEVAALAGAVALGRRRRWWVLALLAGTVALYLAASAGPWMDVRFRVPIVPVLAVLAGLGTRPVVDWLCTKLCIQGVNLGRTEKVGGQPWG